MPRASASSGNRSAPPLLTFERVSRRHRDGNRDVAVFQEVTFSLQRGAFAGLYGTRRSGKSTLLRLAAGIELPDGGSVNLDGRDTRTMSAVQRERLLRGEVGLVFAEDWHPRRRETVVDYVAFALGSDGATLRDARRRARRALARIEIGELADEPAAALSLGERMRVMVARAVVRGPRLLLIDEPAAIPSITEREELSGLLRVLAGELDAALIVASEEMGPLHGADVVMSVGDGDLCLSAREPGKVVPFPIGRAAGSAGAAGEAYRR